MPLHPTQWNGTVIRVTANTSILDLCAAFGLASSGGIFGHLADATCNIMRHSGISPIVKWVDDFVFARVRRQDLVDYNARREAFRKRIIARYGKNPRPDAHGGRIWFRGNKYLDGTEDKFTEDFRFPLKDLGLGRPQIATDAEWCYSFKDIDTLSLDLGILWALDKDLAFAIQNVYHGMVWNIAKRKVALENETRARYLASLIEWRAHRSHTLRKAQKLAGRLQHICYVVPEGRPYLSGLYHFIGQYDVRDHAGRPCNPADKPLTPRTSTVTKIDWWIAKLSTPVIEHTIPCPVEVLDIGVYSDASSEIGIGVVIGKHWGAWRLIAGWKDNGKWPRDIQWAEALGFEFACHHVFEHIKPGSRHIRFWCNNVGVTEAWWKRQSRNTHVNDVFKRLGRYLDQIGASAHTQYVRSASNPADEPSRSILSSLCPKHELPALKLPAELQPFVVDHRCAFTVTKLRNPSPAPNPKVQDRGISEKRHTSADAIDRFHEELVSDPRFWWEDSLK
jgi:hypothetical protein